MGSGVSGRGERVRSGAKGDPNSRPPAELARVAFWKHSRPQSIANPSWNCATVVKSFGHSSSGRLLSRTEKPRLAYPYSLRKAV